MARQAQNNAQSTYNQSQNLTNSSEANSNALYGTLMPAFEQEAVNPQGFTPSQIAAQDTASQQSTGGAVAGATGEANLEAARNRNAGSFAPALDKAARGAATVNSKNALGVQTGNATLEQGKQQSGLSGLSSLYGTNNQDVLSSLGLQTGANNSDIEAGNSGWLQNTLGVVNAITGAGKSAASLGWSPFGSGGGGSAS